MDNNFSPEANKAITQIQKLLNLAAKAGTPEEAAAATAKAQELLAKHNLDVSTVEGARPEDGKREEAKVDGGFYAHQRSLWEAVAELNFCVYWTQQYRVEGWGRDNRAEGYAREWRVITKRRHALVGRVVNARMTIAMAQYLGVAIERITLARLKDNEQHRFGAWAMSFRKGITATVIEKLQDRRHELRDLEERRREQAAADAAAKGFSTSTSLSLASLAASERDANIDHIFGVVGYSARRRAEQAAARAARAQQHAQEEAAYTAWAQANPEAARKQEEAERKKEDRNAARRTGRSHYGTGKQDTTDWGAYRAGRAAGQGISLDTQVDQSGGAKRLGNAR